MMAIHPEIAPYQVRDFPDGFFILKERGGEFLVQQGSAGTQVIYFCGGPDHRGRAVGVGSLNWGNPFRERLSRFSPVGAGQHYAAEINMAGGRQQVDPVSGAPWRGMPVDCVVIDVKNIGELPVGFLIIIAVFRHFIDQMVPQILIPDKIAVQNFHEPRKGDLMLLKNHFPD